MNRCTQCVMPDTRPDTPFLDGVCQACLNYAARPVIDWDARKQALFDLLDRHHGECIVPSSGGKDSHYQVLKLLELGAHVTAVTASTCQLTPVGRQNIDNLARHVDTIEVTPNRTVRAKLNRLGLELVGDISWPEHVGIFTIPWNVADDLGIPLMFYGENPQNQYGGPQGTEEAMQMTERWRSEFGGFLGLRPADMVGKLGITKQDMEPYRLGGFHQTQLEIHYLGQYLPWDSHENARVAIEGGMRCYRTAELEMQAPTLANWWVWENLDNAQTGLHDWFMYQKFGYGRGCAQISVDVRSGRVARDMALQWVEQHDGLYPWIYAGVTSRAIEDQIGMSFDDILKFATQFNVYGEQPGMERKQQLEREGR